MQDFPPSVIDTIYRQLSQFGRVGSTKVLGVPDLDVAIPASDYAQAPPLNFREPGIVIAMYGQELSATPAKFASTRVRVQFGGTEDLFTDGNVGIYRSMLSLFGGAQNWFPMWRRVVPGVTWIVSYQNLDSGATATPELSFAFIADQDIARYTKG